MPGFNHYWTSYNPYQEPGTTVEWTWTVGEGENYWVYSVRPFQLNNDGVEIVRQWTTTDNDYHWTEHFLITTFGPGSGLIRFSALAASGT